MGESVKWGIVSTARIGRTAFLPAVREAGHRVVVVGGRDRDRTAEVAQANSIDRAVTGYEAVITDPEVEAVYVPLPNSLHEEWASKALGAGKAVLCEKPLCGSLEGAVRLLKLAESSSLPLWEAFVFPFLAQQRRIEELIRDGAIGEVRKIQSQFHFRLDNPANIRFDPALGGGGLYDVGCYPVRFAQLVFGDGPEQGTAMATWANNVDVELEGILEFPGQRQLILSCGMRRNSGTFSRVIGDEGELRVTNPFHARDFDTLEIRVGDGVREERLGSSAPSFTDAVVHIGRVVRGLDEPRHTAIDDSLSTEVGLDILIRSAKSGRVEKAASPQPLTTVAPEL